MLGPTLSTLSQTQLSALVMQLTVQQRVDAWAYTIQSSSRARITFLEQCSKDNGSFFCFAKRWVCEKEQEEPGCCFTFQVDVVKDCLHSLSTADIVTEAIADPL